jgi:Fungal N-terminal domain of STAND proteins
MEGLGIATSVIAVIELSAKISSVCVQYSRAVKDATKDISRLQGELKSLQDVLEKVKPLLDGPNGSRLSASLPLSETLKGCLSQLQTLQSRLSPSIPRKYIGQIGLRALKWPFEIKEADKVVRQLERCKQSISLALQVDQT